MEKRQIKGSILLQVAVLFALGILATGLITYISQHKVSDAGVKRQTESLAAEIADEVELSVREYPACEWLIQYWYEHAGEMDIEYDADYAAGTETEQKCRLLGERYPDLVLEYADVRELEAMPKADQKLYAEIAYSWLVTRVDEIKRAHGVDYLFCVLTDDTYETQFFLFSAADPGAVRGTSYEEVYTLGTTVTVTESQREAMRAAGYEIPIFGLAKRLEEIFLPGREGSILIDHHSPVLHLIQRIRDESHRYAITFHRSLRGKESTHSRLEDIPGIGPARRKALMRHFKSLEEIRSATREELLSVPELNERTVDEILQFFDGQQGGQPNTP